MLSLLALLALASPVPAPPSEVRALWVVRTALVSPAAVDAVVDDAARAGFNTLLVQVRGRADAYYSSRLAPRGGPLHGQPKSFDPLARLLARARQRHLGVHAWVNVLLAAGFGQRLPPDHIVARHPEWLMVPRVVAARALRAPRGQLPDLVASAREEGKVEGFYLSPSAAGVPEHLEAVVDELLRAYALDGLHLDFIRYPGGEYDYSQAALAGFAALSNAPPGNLLQGPLRDPAGWTRYRQDTVTDLAARLARAARSARPGTFVSAAVVPEEAVATAHRFQEWGSWLEQGIVDAVCPMAYTPEFALFRRQVAEARARAGALGGIWIGVGAYRLTPEETIERIRVARSAGASGIVVFSHESLAGRDLDGLRQQAFPALAPPGAAAFSAPPR